MALQQLQRQQAPSRVCASSRSRNVSHVVSSRARAVRRAPFQQKQQFNHHLVQQPSFLKPEPFEYELRWDPKTVPAAPMVLKQSQFGTVIGVVAAVQAVYTELANIGLGGAVAAGVVTAGAMALWWAASNKAASASKPQATSPVKPSSNTYDDLASHLPSSPVLALSAPSSKALMAVEPAASPALPEAKDPTAAVAAAAAAAAAALTDAEAAIVAAQLVKSPLNLASPAFAGVSVNLLEPGLVRAQNLSLKGHAGVNSIPNPAIMEHGRQKTAAWLARTETNTLGLPRLDVPAGSSVEVLFKQKWQSLLLHAVTPEDWAGGRRVTWADLRVLAAYGVPLAGEVEEGVVSGVAAEAAVESVGGAAGSVDVAVVPSSGAVVAAVNVAKVLAVRQAGLKKLLGAVKLSLPLVVAAVTFSGFRDLF